MQRAVEELAARLMADVAAGRRRVVESQRRADAAQGALSELEGILRAADSPQDARALQLIAALRGQLPGMREECADSWLSRLDDWSRGLRVLRDELGGTVSLAALGELSASVAHEIRNPLCGMLLSVEVLQTKLDPDDSRMALLENLQREIEKMEKIVNNLLHFARAYEPKPVPCELGDVVNKTLDSVRAHLRKRRIGVRVTHLNGQCEARVDPDMVQQVFRNIVMNSVDASRDGGEVEIELNRVDGAPYVTVAIRDWGVGIPQEHVGRIFEPFFTSKHSGVGLGLAVSKKIVDAHRGRIDVASEPGKGSTFTVVLPIAEECARECVVA